MAKSAEADNSSYKKDVKKYISFLSDKIKKISGGNYNVSISYNKSIPVEFKSLFKSISDLKNQLHDKTKNEKRVNADLKKLNTALSRINSGKKQKKVTLPKHTCELKDVAISLNELIKKIDLCKAEKKTFELDLKKYQDKYYDLKEKFDEGIIESTKDLAKRIVVLDKMNKLMVGRELKMVQLKEKIKDLESKLRIQKPKKKKKVGKKKK